MRFSISGQRFFFTVNTNLLDQMTSKFIKNHFNTTVRGHNFSQRIINDWNALPPDVVCAPNVFYF